MPKRWWVASLKKCTRIWDKEEGKGFLSHSSSSEGGSRDGHVIMEKKPWFCFWAIVKSLLLTINSNLIKGFSLFCATLSSSFSEEIGIFLSISLFAMYIYARLYSFLATSPTWYSEPHFYPFLGLLFLGYIYQDCFFLDIYIYIYRLDMYIHTYRYKLLLWSFPENQTYSNKKYNRIFIQHSIYL